MISPLKKIDRVLDRVTMYRLAFYVLAGLIAIAVLEGAFGLLPYAPVAILMSVVLATATCWCVNEALARMLGAARSVESVYITAFILALILPPAAWGSAAAALVVIAASVLAIVSKYVFAFRRKHLFNPAAFGVAATGALFGGYASWWVGGNLALLPFVVIGGFVLVRKLRRFDLVLAFLFIALCAIGATTPTTNVFTTFELALVHTPLLFFASVMLTEPLTTPPTRALRFIYAALAGVLFAPAVHVGNVYSSPEIALLVANLFSFIVSPKGRFTLKLLRTEETSASTRDFVYQPDRPLIFKPGQYLEWTVPHAKPDARGTRRYFTIASSPTERELRLGVKFHEKGSSLKNVLRDAKPDSTIVVSQLAGDFILPSDKNAKLVFIAGGIGITPFRSMVRFMLDTGDTRSVTLLYANRTVADVAYRSLWDEAAAKSGMKTLYAFTDPGAASAQPGSVSAIDASVIEREVPEYRVCMFYLSGPHAMVISYAELLSSMGIPASQIKKDFFPGLA